jgi:Holliday junction resolvasome RuvABC endonuclease subunit
MKILAIDQATKTGYAVVENGKILESGVWKLADSKRSGESRGMRYIRFEKCLEDVQAKHGFDLVVHEQTLLRGGAATEIANGLKALVLKFAARHGIEVTCVHTSELKRFATGRGNADKAEMIDACIVRSMVIPEDDNEADAVLIGLWADTKFGNG